MESNLQGIAFSQTEGAGSLQTSADVFKRPRSIAFISATGMMKSFGVLPPQKCDMSVQTWPRCANRSIYLSTKSNHGNKGADNNGEEKGSFANQSNGMSVYRSNGRRRPAGDLPFDVSIVSPPPRYLGRFQLDPHTHCGDILEHDGHHFEVKVVRMRYRLQQGRYQVISKAIEVKSLARKAIEIYLERKFESS